LRKYSFFLPPPTPEQGEGAPEEIGDFFVGPYCTVWGGQAIAKIASASHSCFLFPFVSPRLGFVRELCPILAIIGTIPSCISEVQRLSLAYET